MILTNRLRIAFLLSLLGIAFLPANSIYGKEPEWFLKMKEIKVLQSKRQDVLRVYNYPKITYSSNENPKETGWGEIVRYETKDGKLRVFYSTGRCSKLTNADGLDVDKDVVVNIGFEPANPVELRDLDLDLRTFTGYKESDTQYFEYRSEELGMDFTLLGGKVTSIEYSLTPKMRELDCERILKN